MTTVMSPETIREIQEMISKELTNDLSKDVYAVLKEKGITLPTGRLPLGNNMGTGSQQKNARTDDFDSFGQFLHTVYRVNNKGVSDTRLKILQEQSGETGGFLVPEQYRMELMQDALEEAFFRPRARVIPISGPTSIPRVDVTSHASSVHGGVVAYWRKEGTTLSSDASEPVFGSVRLDPKDLIGYTQVSNQLIADSAIALEPLIRSMFADALTFYEEEAFVNGDGAGEPLGILNSDCVVSVAKETGQAPATLVSENLDKMYQRMLPRSMNRAVWLVHPDAMPQLASLSRAVGVGGNSVWMTNIADSAPVTIYGRPVIFTEHCQTLGTTGDIYFADLAYYIIADRQALAVSSSEHIRFATNETAWRFIQRLDGQPWLRSPLTPKHGTNTFSPFVKLDTRD